MWRINRTYRNLQRMQNILNVLLKHGFGQIIRRLGLHRLLPLGKQASAFASDERTSTEPLTLPERFRLVLEELGPTFIKFGQVLSSRPDIIPESFIHELKKLREDVRPLPYGIIRASVEKELNQPIPDIYEWFDPEPAAAASIGQVHFARLKTGDEVVVKVLRPGIEKIIRNDLDILIAIAGLIDRHLENLAQFDPIGLVREFEKTILKEVDFTVEAVNTERFYHNLKDDESVVIPKVYWEYSSRSVLILERLRGFPMDDFQRIEEAGLDKSRLAREGMRIFLRQILEFGFFHADPHPGNVLALPNGKIGLVDFGMVGRLDPNTDENLSSLILGILNQDYGRMVVALKGLGFEFEDVKTTQVQMELRELVEIYYGLPLKRIGISDLIMKLIESVMKYDIKVPPNFFLLTRAMVVAEGIGRQLDPTIDVVAIGKPMIVEILKRRSDPQKMMKEMLVAANEMRHCATVLPGYVETLFSKLCRGNLRIEFSHVNLETFYHEMERLGNRIAYSAILSALIIGSSLVILSDKGPLLFGMPALGMIGYALAGIVCIFLIVSIVRSGKI